MAENVSNYSLYSASTSAEGSTDGGGSGGGDGGGGGGQCDVSEEGEESESSSSSPSTSPSTITPFIEWGIEGGEDGGDGIEAELAAFRNRWQSEISVKSKQDEDDDERKAKDLFISGIKHEQNNRFGEAIVCYRHALQLDSQVEIKVSEEMLLQERIGESSQSGESADPFVETGAYSEAQFVGGCESASVPTEYELDQNGNTFHCETLCQPARQNKGFHISSLPPEMIQYILRWVISSELDMRSLETLSLVCRGFYQLARDEDLWRMACNRVWGVRCGVPGDGYKYSYRSMFIERPHVLYQGCYISRTSYLRHGEQGLDSYYRPWFTIEYFRFLRFYPDGCVTMLTSSEDPATCVSKLRYKMSTNVTVGTYKLSGDMIIVVIDKPNSNPQQMSRRLYGNRRNIVNNNNANEPDSQTLHMEFEVNHIGKRRHCGLTWKNYFIKVKHRNGQEVKSEFDIQPSKFPPLYFSRVKSYSLISEKVLE